MKLSKEQNAWCLAMIVSSLALFAACAHHEGSVEETETHFLRSCEGSCGAGLSCICGVCTEPCSSEAACGALPGSASCAELPASCSGEVAMACDVACEGHDDCSSLGDEFMCRAGRCRIGEGGTSGVGGTSGAGGQGGQSGVGGSSGGAGGAAGTDRDSGAGDAAVDGGPDDATVDGGTGDDACDAIGEACCDPFPGDGPNYCNGVRLQCGANNLCEPNCDCPLGAYVPVCGVDGETYDATCGDACVPAAIACRGECPCPAGYCAVSCTGAAPDQEVVDACAAITDMTGCTTYETGGFPSFCRWVTPDNSMCPPLP